MRSVAALVALVACSQSAQRRPQPGPVAPPAARTLTIIGTNDLHGALERLPLLAGFVANVRAARATDGGGVLLLDGGDLFQGTLESNIAEGADVVRAYNQMGYAASAIGNHEFDYGPVGPAVTIQLPNDDPRGALEARIREAKFPFLVANIADEATGKRIDWPNAPASTLIEVAGIKVGLVGVTTETTPYTTMPANFKGLKMIKPGPAIVAETRVLRGRGAQLIVVVAHLGSECSNFDRADDSSSCDRKEELFRLLDELPQGTVDVVVAGHTHAMVAHKIDGVAVIESLSSGRAFGRVDLRVAGGKIIDVTIHKPELVCPLDKERNPIAVADCHPAPYEGKPVVPDPAVATIVEEAVMRAGPRRSEKLGVTLASAVTKSYGSESAEGDLVTDLMLAAQPGSDVALTNGGGLRADLPAGELTYGHLFEAMPFDNRFALVDLTGKQLGRLIAGNLQRGAGIFSWGGLTAKAQCKDGKLDLAVTVGGKPVVDDKTYHLVTSDFLASGGDGALGKLKLPAGAIKPTDTIIREAIAELLRKRKGTLAVPAVGRLDFPGKRPVRCSTEEPE